MFRSILFLVATAAVNAALVLAALGDDARPSAPPAQGTDNLTRIDIPMCHIHVVDRALVAAERDGVLDRMVVRVGDKVEKGAELAHLRDHIAKAHLNLSRVKASSDVNVRYAQAVLDTAKQDYEQALQLRQDRAVTDTEFRRKKFEFERGGLTVEQSEFEFRLTQLETEVAEAEFNAYHVSAPFAGVIHQVLKSSGESVQDGQPIVELVNTDRVRIEGYGRLVDLWDMQPGVDVEVQLFAPELERFGVTQERFRGMLIHVDSLVQPVTNQVRVVAEVKNRDNILRDGLRAHMQILVPPKPAATIGAKP